MDPKDFLQAFHGLDFPASRSQIVGTAKDTGGLNGDVILILEQLPERMYATAKDLTEEIQRTQLATNSDGDIQSAAASGISDANKGLISTMQIRVGEISSQASPRVLPTTTSPRGRRARLAALLPRKEHTMDDILTFDRFSELKGTEVRSADDAKVGSVNALFCDDLTKEPEWIGLGTGFLGMKEAVVPVQGARVDGKRIVVPYDKDVIKHEPAFDEEGGMLTPESEHRMCVYFSLTGHRSDPHQLTRYDFMRTES